MKFLVLVLALLCFGCGCGGAQQAAQQRTTSMWTMMDATAALVKRDPDTLEPRAFCSGVWIEERVILTAAHCVRGVEEIDYAVYSAASEDEAFPFALPARVVKRADDLDLALLMILDDVPPAHGIARMSVYAPNVGDQLHVIGHTLGLPWSYSPGWVAGYRPELFGEKIPRMQVGSFGAPGNSGGPVFNADGEVVGIFIEWLGLFSVPAPYVGFAVRGSVVRGFLES